MMAWTFFAAATLLPTTASAAGYGVSSADALAIALVSIGSVLVLLGMCGTLFLSQREQPSVPEYPAPLHVPELESASTVRHPTMRVRFEVPAGPDGYGVRLATRQVPPGIAGGAGERRAAPRLLRPDKNRTPTWTSATHEPQHLAVTAAE